MSIAAGEAAQLDLEAPSGLWRDAFDRIKRNPGAIVGFIILLIFLGLAVFAPQIAKYAPNDTPGGLDVTPPGPNGDFYFGLDEQGRDLFARIVFGTRLSLLVGIVSVTVGLTLGLLLGSLAGYFGRWVDTLIMRFMDVMLAFPGFLLAVGLVTVLGRGLWQIMVAVGITNVPIFARLLRGSILSQRESDYVLAARSVGTPGRQMLLRHILPNSLAPVIVQATLAMATAIIDVAGLSFVGLGPQDPGLPEWGKILADNATRLESAAHLVFFPGFAVVLSVLALNLIGDGLREAIDPKLRKK